MTSRSCFRHSHRSHRDVLWNSEPDSRLQYTDFEMRFSIQIEKFVTSISFRGTFKSFRDLTGKGTNLVQSALLWISQPDFQNQSILEVLWSACWVFEKMRFRGAQQAEPPRASRHQPESKRTVSYIPFYFIFHDIQALYVPGCTPRMCTHLGQRLLLWDGRGLYQEGDTLYYWLRDLLSKVDWVVWENSVLVALSAIKHSEALYYLWLMGGLDSTSGSLFPLHRSLIPWKGHISRQTWSVSRPRTERPEQVRAHLVTSCRQPQRWAHTCFHLVKRNSCLTKKPDI